MDATASRPLPPSPPGPSAGPQEFDRFLRWVTGWVPVPAWLRHVILWAVPVFVWGVWALMLYQALWMVYHFGSPVPLQDDWYYVPVVTGHQPFTLGWLLEPFYDHKLFLTRWLVFTHAVLAGGDFRLSMYFNVLAMASLAAGMVLVARRVRGWTSPADVFFPLALLGLSQYDPFLQAMPLGHILTTTLGGTLLLVIVHTPGLWSRRATLLAGAAFLALALGCASGMPYVPALTGFLGFVIVQRARRTGSKLDLALLIFPLAAAAYVLPFLVTYERPAGLPTDVDLGKKLLTALSVLGMGLGLSIHPWLPWPGVAVAVLMAVAGVGLARAGYVRPAERFRALGLFAYLGALATLAVGLGWGRAAHLGYGYASHYVTVALPVLCCLYFAGEVIHAPAGRVLQVALALVMIVLLRDNTLYGLGGAVEFRAKTGALETTLRAGMTPEMIVEEVSLFPFEGDPNGLLAHLRMLQKARVGMFAHMPEKPAHDEIALPLPPALMSDVKLTGTAGRVTGPEPTLLFHLPEKPYVYGVRIMVTYRGADENPANLRASWWRLNGEETEGLAGGSYEFDALAEGNRVTCWVNDRVEFFCLCPDPRVKEFRLTGVTLLVPREKPAAP